MKFTYTLTLQDMANLNFWHWQKGLMKLRVTLSILVALAVFFAIQVGYGSRSMPVEAGVSLAIGFGGFLLTGSKWYKNHYMKVLEKDMQKKIGQVTEIQKVLTAHEVLFSEELIQDSYADDIRAFFYSDITDIDSDRASFYLTMSNKKVLMLPFRAFENEKEKQAFETMLQERTK